MVFGYDRGKMYPWDGLVVIWDPSDCFALYYGYLGGIYGFFSDDVIYGNSTVPDLIILYSFFYCMCRRPSYKFL